MELAHLPQSHLIGHVLRAPNYLDSPPLYPLWFLSIVPGLGDPKLDTIFQM